MRRKKRFLVFAFAAVCLLTLGLGWVSPVQAITYSGRGFAAFVNVPTLGIGPTFISDTGELPPSGGFRSAELESVEIPGVLSAKILISTTSGANSVAQSSASLAVVDVLNGLLRAEMLRAESEATCNGVRGSTEVLNLQFAGTDIVVDPFAPNQKFGPITVPGVGTATLIINEQNSSSGPGFREITVNAVHLTVTGAVEAEVILSSAYSDINGCPGCPPVPECHDFVTGGGWINVGSSRANFGFNVGFKPNSATPEVHFNYIDHNTGMHVKATSISVYVEGTSGSNSRRFEGNAEINGLPGTYSIEVADNGEPGRKADTFNIRLSNGYSAAGPLDGGNIQLHKPCP